MFVFPKGGFLRFERMPFTLRKVTFYNAKGILLEAKRMPFGKRYDADEN